MFYCKGGHGIHTNEDNASNYFKVSTTTEQILRLNETTRSIGHEHDHSKHGTQHLDMDGFSSFVFKSDVPISLSTFNNFLESNLAESIYRIKGVAWFREQRHMRCIIQISGRRRLQFREIGEWKPLKPFSNIIFIGKHVDQTELQKFFGVKCTTSLSQNALQNNVKIEMSFIAKKFSSDPRFEIVSHVDKSQGFFDILYFRLTGANLLDCTTSKLQRFQFFSNTINRSLLFLC